MIRLAVFGSPVAHSLSPRIHGLFARQCGLEVDYRALEATAETFPGLVRAVTTKISPTPPWVMKFLAPFRT